MTPRGSRLACSLLSIDGCTGTFSAQPGTLPLTLSVIEPVQWDRPPGRPVLQASFTLIGEMGMTGTMVVLNQYQWRDLVTTQLDEPFLAAVLWGRNPLKVVEDAGLVARMHLHKPAVKAASGEPADDHSPREMALTPR